MRSRFRVTSVDTDIHIGSNEDAYMWGRATDGTKYENVLMSFAFWFSPDDPVRVGDIISGEFADPKNPNVIHHIFVEERYTEPVFFVEPEPIELPEPPAPAPVESQDWRYALMNNQFLAPVDIFQMAQALVRLEARVKQLESVKS